MSPNIEKFLKRWLPAVIIMAAVFVWSAQSGASISENTSVDASAHKVTHLAIYSLLTISFYKATKHPLLAALLSILYGISDEIHQTFTPTRSGQLFDVYVDSFASLLTGLILWKYFHRLPKKLQIWLSE